MTQRYRLIGTAGVCATIALMSACGSHPNISSADGSVDAASLYASNSPSDSRPRLPPADSATPTPTSAAVVSENDSLPPGHTGELVPGIEAYIGALTPEQKLILNQAFYLQVKQCMSDNGFTLLDPPPTLETPQPSVVLYDVYIGVLDPTYAKQFGYQLDPKLTKTGTAGENSSPVSVESPNKDYEFALKVAGGDGCRGQARAMIDNGRPSEEKSALLLGKIYEESVHATYADPAYKKAQGAWSACMKAGGYNYSSPESAYEEFNGFAISRAAIMGNAPTPTNREIGTALTDVTCKRTTKIADVFRSVLWHKQMDMAQKNLPALKVLSDVNATLLRNAQEMIKHLSN